MEHRFGRRTNLGFWQRDVATVYGASHAWRAEDAVDDGTVTTALRPVVGGAVLTRDGAGQPVKATSSNWFGRHVVPFSNAASFGYSGAITITASMAVLVVARVTLNASGFYAITAAGALNSGNSVYRDVNLYSGQKLATHADVSAAPSIRAVTLNVLTASGTSFYMNSVVAIAAAQAGALVGDTMTIGAITPGGVYTMTGEFRSAMVFPYAPDAATAAAIMRAVCSKEGVIL